MHFIKIGCTVFLLFVPVFGVVMCCLIKQTDIEFSLRTMSYSLEITVLSTQGVPSCGADVLK